MIKKLFYGFTIAELIVAMSVIGVVAAITLPSVITNHQNKVLQMSLQKAYRDLDNNLEELHASNYRKTFYQSLLASTDGIKDFFINYYDIPEQCEELADGTKSCTYPNLCGEEGTPDKAQPCFAANYADISTTTDKAFTCTGGRAVQLKDNTAICIIPAAAATPAKDADPEAGTEAEEAKEAVPATIYMDVNGSEPPNIGGRDMFKFQINNYTIVDNSEEASCTTSSVGEGCLKKIINDKWKVKY